MRYPILEMDMKMIPVLAVGFFGMVGAASADVKCEAVMKTAGSQVIRGVRVHDDSVEFDETVWFGLDASMRDRAARACMETTNSTSCSETTPKASDRFMNVGDPGFGPRLYVEKSTRAGILSLQWVPADVSRYFPSGYASLQGKYFAFYSACEEARSELALDVVQNHQKEFLRIAHEKFLKEHPQLERDSDWRMMP